MNGTILVGVDGSAESVQAAALGASIARASSAPCRLIHAVADYWSSVATPDVPINYELLADAARQHARAIVSQALVGHVPEQLILDLDVETGRAPIVLEDEARRSQAELVVMGGKRRRALARIGGSTVTHMVRLGSFPVLATDGVGTSIRRILVCVDLSYAARPTLEVAQLWAGRLGAELRVLHAVEPVPVIPGMRVRLADDDMYRSCQRAVDIEISPLVTHPDAETVVRRGRAAAVITAEVRQWNADLVVLGSHGRGWVDRLLIGSTSERLLNVLPASVMVIPVAKPADVLSRGRIAMPWEAVAR